MSMDTFTIPEYTPAAFVNCADAIEFVTLTVRQVYQDTSISPRVIIFSNAHGGGKSWLLFHLARTVLPKLPATKALLFHFSQFKPDVLQDSHSHEWTIAACTEHSIDTLVFEIVHWLARCLYVPVEAAAPPKDCINAIVDHVRLYLDQQAIVLLCDDLLEFQGEMLSQLEQHVLAPLGVLQNVLFVLTSRGQMVSWESPYLQLATVYQTLQPFAIAEIEAQLDHQEHKAVRSAAQIKEYGAGHPINNLFLAQEANLDRAFQAIRAYLLGSTQKYTEDHLLYDALDALCVLEGFREDEIAKMLTEYYKGINTTDWDTAQVRKVRDLLTETQLVYWSQDQFVMHESLGCVLEHRLRLSRYDLWIRLHWRAYCFYETWARSYPQVATEYRQRADYHSLVLHGEKVRVEDYRCQDIPLP